MENKKEFNFLDLFKNSSVFTIKNGKCVGKEKISENMKEFYIKFIEEKIKELVKQENGIYKLPCDNTKLGYVVDRIACNSVYYDLGVFKTLLEFGNGCYGFYLNYKKLLECAVTQTKDNSFIDAIVDFISKKKLSINLEYPVILACVCGNLHALKLLKILSNEYNTKQKKDETKSKSILACCDNEPLIQATIFNKPKIVDYLLKYKNEGVNPGVRKNGPIYNACKHGTPEMVKNLLKHKEVDPCANNFKPLHVAYEIKDKELIKILHNDERVSKRFKDFEESKIQRKKQYKE